MVSNKCWNTVDQFFFSDNLLCTELIIALYDNKNQLHYTPCYSALLDMHTAGSCPKLLMDTVFAFTRNLSQFSFLPPIVTKTNLAVHEDKNKATFVKVCEWLCPASVADTQYNIVLLPNCTHHQLHKIGIPTSPPHSSPCQSSQQGTCFPGERGEGGKHGWQACEWSATITHMGGNADAPASTGRTPHTVQ